LAPKNALAHRNRAGARKSKGDLPGTVAGYYRAIELDPAYAPGYNGLAWLWATSTQDSFRNGKRAVSFARKAVSLTKPTDPSYPDYIDTLAAAYAESGDFTQAAKWQKKALMFPEFAQREGEKARLRLELYRTRKPYRE
jgi:tetratricopeptide (TPR) repeat protein